MSFFLLFISIQRRNSLQSGSGEGRTIFCSQSQCNASSLRFSFVVIEGPIACQFDAAKWDLLEGEIMNGEKTESNFGCFCCQILEGIAI